MVNRLHTKTIICASVWMCVFTISLLIPVAGKAQSYQRKIQWETTPKSISTLNNEKIKVPTFVNASHSEQMELLPVYGEKIALNSTAVVKAEIKNAVYEPVSGLNAKQMAILKPEPSIEASLTIARKQPFASVRILPFRKTAGGEVEKLVSFTLALTLTPQGQLRASNSYAANSVLASGSWFKLGISGEGMYKIDYAFVKNTLGIDPASFNFSTLAIYGNGGGMVPDENSKPRADDLLENPTLINDANGNNRLDDGDYLLFYAQGPDVWRYDSGNKTFSHEKNLYTDKNYYFLTTDRGTGKRTQVSGVTGNSTLTVTDFDDYAFRESDEENMLESGKTWLGDKMTSFSNTKTFAFSFPNLITDVPVQIKSSIAGKTVFGSTTTVSINGTNVISHFEGGIGTSGSYPPGGVPNFKTATYNATGDQLTVVYSFNVGSDPSGTAAGYIDWFELFAKRRLIMSGNFMPFRNGSIVNAGAVARYELENANSNILVWNVTNPGNIHQVNAQLNGSQLSWNYPADELQQFIAFNPFAAYPAPENAGSVGNQNLHAMGQPDMVIVTFDAFEAASNDLADFHRQNSGLTVQVVKLSQVYNEFSSGRKDISAIRDMMRMLYERAGSDTAQLPKYLLLMGDGSFDPKDRTPDNKEFVPTYQSTESYNQLTSFTSDDFFVLLDTNEGGNIAATEDLDVAVGRLPVESEQEAWDVVNKIKNYKFPKQDATCVQVTTNNSWRNNITFVADDEDSNIHLTSSDFLAENTRLLYPEYNYDKIYLDAYKQIPTPAGDRYPDVNTAILNRINAGTLILNWVGHGGVTNWAQERIFNMSDIVVLNNREKLPLFITATCDFSRFDLPDRTAGEWLVVNPNGGAIASLTTVRLVFSSANDALNRAAFDYLFLNKHNGPITMGEITRLTKNNANTDITNTRKFVLLGDPALTLNYPRYNVVTTKVNNKPLGAVNDTLKALSEITISGELRDENNNKMTGFNGTVYPVVYDKISTIFTMGNDPGSSVVPFKMYRNLLFRGKASVTNGEFSFSFIVPKDIDYQFGKGRISYYADNATTDAHGYTEQIVIGGAADSFAADGIGPEMRIFMNDEKFVFGGTTNTEPLLLVKLQDQSGINTVGNGIGHDLVAELNDTKNQKRLVLNDYYASELDNFRKGEIRYPFSKLAEGRYSLKVKAWDIHNNSSEDYTEFVVANNAKLALNHVYNYPNPFTTRTRFMFEHNRCCDDLNVSVQIYTVSGKLVKSIQQQVYSEGYRVDDIEWDGKDDYGDPIGKGVYVYKVTVRDSQGSAAHKFEKLVVLR